MPSAGTRQPAVCKLLSRCITDDPKDIKQDQKLLFGGAFYYPPKLRMGILEKQLSPNYPQSAKTQEEMEFSKNEKNTIL